MYAVSLLFVRHFFSCVRLCCTWHSKAGAY